MIEIKNGSIGYKLTTGKQKVIHSDLSLTISDGELTALLGANGAGKSTLIKSITGFIPLLSGSVFVGGRDINSYSEGERAREIGVVLTSRAADGGLTVFDLVAFGRYPYTDYFGTLKRKDVEIVEEAMASVGVLHLRDSYISRISDGERQKAMIAKVLAQQCQTIILDEPTAFLDVKSRLETYSLLRKIAHEQKKCVLLSTHDLEITLRHADTLLIVPKNGEPIIDSTEELIFSGKIETLFEDEGRESTMPTRRVKFDNRDGSFRIDESTKGSVSLMGKDEKLLFWVRNALVRNGYTATTALGGDFVVEVVSSNQIILNHTTIYSSVRKLVDALD